MEETESLISILYKDKDLVAINKPHGLLVHRSSIAKDATEFALQIVRNQIGQRVHLIHRLDRKTSGVLLLGLNPKITSLMQELFIKGAIKKEYICIVRGFFPDVVEVDYALKNDRGKTQEAFTSFECLQRTDIKVPHGKWITSTYSLVRATPKTGRQHQIRKHLAHIMHPIIGDRPHGCNKQNRLFKEKWNMMIMLLHANTLKFKHPILNEDIQIQAAPSDEFVRIKDLLFKINSTD